MTTKISHLSLIVGVALAITTSAAEATSTWSFGSSGANNNIASAYRASNVASGGSANDATGTLGTTSLVTNWSGGLGAGGESSEPSHAIDNQSYTEAVLLNLGGSYQLSQFSVGYAYHKIASGTTFNSTNFAQGADVSVFAYTGSNAPALTGQTFSGLLSAYSSGTNTGGWKLIGNYANVSSVQNVTTSQSSSYWLIAAYNSVFGACASCSNAHGTSGYIGADYFKLSGIQATNGGGGGGGGQVPEPSPMALLGAALLGTIALRRRQTR